MSIKCSAHHFHCIRLGATIGINIIGGICNTGIGYLPPEPTSISCTIQEHMNSREYNEGIVMCIFFFFFFKSYSVFFFSPPPNHTHNSCKQKGLLYAKRHPLVFMEDSSRERSWQDAAGRSTEPYTPSG